MRFLFLILMITLAHDDLITQRSNEYWIMGNNGRSIERRFGNYSMNFSNPLSVRDEEFLFDNANSAQYRYDTVLFLSNGCDVQILDWGQIPDSHSLNPGTRRMNCDGNRSYDLIQSLFFIPRFNDTTILDLIHHHTNDFLNPFLPAKISYSTIDAHNKKVVSLNNVLSEHAATDNLIGVRHGNGRDWWIYSPSINSTGFTRMLFSEGQGQDVKTQEFTAVLDEPGLKQLAISPDGSMLAEADYNNGLMLYDLDRCTGALFNRKSYSSIISDESKGWGVEFSESGRFLYFSTLTHIYQIDLANDPELSNPVEIAEWDWHFWEGTWPTSFANMKRGPDGKIYIHPASQNVFIHVIHEPEKASQDCDFRLRDLEMPYRNSRTFPLSVNTELSDLSGSPCDTLGIDNGVLVNTDDLIRTNDNLIKIFPNPATDVVYMDIPEKTSLLSVRILNFSGELVIDKHGQGIKSISISELHAGIYSIILQVENGDYYIQKMIVK